MDTQKALKELAWLFISYSEHTADCDKFDDLPADEADMTERRCTCGLDLAKSEWQEKYGSLNEICGLTPFAPDSLWAMPFSGESSLENDAVS